MRAAMVLSLVSLLAGIAAPAHGMRQLRLPVPANDIVYDPADGMIYASVPSRASGIGNTITRIDPGSGAIGPSVFVGSEPGVLALSDDGHSLYVALGGASAVRRFDVATMTAGVQFSLGSDPFFGPYRALDIAVQPGHPDVVAVALGNSCCSPGYMGLAIFDQGVARGQMLPSYPIMDAIAFGSDPSRLYGYNAETTGYDFTRVTVDATGPHVLDSLGSLLSGFSTRIVYDRGRVYGSNGQVVDPEARTLLGTFSFPDFTYGTSVAPDSARVYFLSSGSFFYGSPEIFEFDAATFTPVKTRTLAGSYGSLGQLVRWGADGLAFSSDSGVVVLSAVHAAVVADLALSQTDNPDPAQVGYSVTYTVRVENHGPDAADQVVVRDRVPDMTTYHFFNTQRGSVSDSSGWGVWNVGTLAAGDSAVMTLVQGTSAPGTLVNVATASSATTDPDSSNNVSAEATQVVPAGATDIDVWVTLGATPASPGAGQPFQLTAYFGNRGPARSGPAVLQAILYGPGVRVLSASSSRGFTIVSEDSVVCDADSLAAGDSIRVDIQAISDSSGYVNCLAQAFGTGTESSYYDNQAYLYIPILPSALQLTRNLLAELDSIALKRNVDRSLTKDLNAVLADLAARDTSAACADLYGFIADVNRQAGRQLDVDQAFYLIRDARPILTLLACGPPKKAQPVALAGGIPPVPVLELASATGVAPVRLRFSLPESAPARIDVFDLQGRHARTLLDARVEPGYHEVAWDAAPRHAAPGLYFARLTSARGAAVVRVLLRP
ncbi:MAG TPA: hypothetical protein VFK69_10930 [Candidatus Eisenbacteria bacterium]|nr:hypothetical protein [Candidatus Eisenbacteria bacterium]